MTVHRGTLILVGVSGVKISWSLVNLTLIGDIIPAKDTFSEKIFRRFLDVFPVSVDSEFIREKWFVSQTGCVK